MTRRRTDATHCAARPDRVADGQAKIARLVDELRRVILGKEQAIDEVVAALLARGHVLLEGLPGLGKTELVKALSRLLSLDFRRIQFTPDLLPTDITGSHILQERDGRKEFVFHPGPSSPTCCSPTRSTAPRRRRRRRCSRRCRSGA